MLHTEGNPIIEKWRLFIALELPNHLIETLADLQDWLREEADDRGLRWVTPSSIHLTLKFLGDTPASQVKTLRPALDRAGQGHKPFRLVAYKLGHFGSPRNPRVLWVGLSGQVRPLGELQTDIEAAMAELGYPIEDRDFHPHLTLARTKSRSAGKAVAQMLRNLDQRPLEEEWAIDSFSLIRSELTPDGPVYTTLHEVTLQGDETDE